MAFLEIARLNQLKSALTVTVYGSYEPYRTASLGRLVALRRCLRANGYSKASLVSDYSLPQRQESETDEEYSTRLSLHWIDYSQVNIFALFCDIEQGSVGVELGYLVASAAVPKTIVLFEGGCSSSFATLVRGSVGHANIERDTFSDDEDLCTKATAKCFNTLHSV